MIKDKLVSVIIPVYNRENFIKNSIRSILEQTYKNIELIVINDGSQDSTEKKVYEISDPRIKYFNNSTNRGVSSARNLGIKYSSGSIIMFQDSDDIAYPNRIEKQLSALLACSGKTGAVYCGMELVDKNTGIKIKDSFHQVDFRKNFTTGDNLLTPGTGTLMIKKEVLEKVGYFDERLLANEDTEIAIRITKIYDYAGVGESLVRVIRNHDQLMNNPHIYIHAKEIIYQKHKDYLSKNILLKLCKIVANYYILSGDHEKAMFYIAEAISLKKDLKTILQFSALKFLPGFTELIYKARYKNLPLSSGL